MIGGDPLDTVFIREIKRHSSDWQMRAIAGLTSREVFGVTDEGRAWARKYGLSGCSTAEEEQAWLFGYDWLDTVALRTARSMLADLLIGRVFRLSARDSLHATLEAERLGAPAELVTADLDRASHQEWIGVLAERGCIAWGGRLNRCGSPEGREVT